MRAQAGIGSVYPVEFTEFGTGRPIFFVHGWRLSGFVESSDMEPAFEGLNGWRRIYPDLPGMGLSKPDTSIRNLDDYVQALASLIQLEAPASGFAIAGTSAGAALARAVAHSLSEEVRGMMLRVPMLNFSRRPTYASDNERDARFDAEPAEPWLPPSLALEAEKKRQRLWQPARLQAASMGAIHPIREDPERYVLTSDMSSQLVIPTLVITGRQDQRAGYADGLSVLEQYPRATIAVLDRASHVLPTGSPELHNALVRDWLLRMDEVWQ